MTNPAADATVHPYRAIPLEETTTAPSPAHCLCPRCRGWVVAKRPHWAWKLAEMAFWVSCPLALMVMKSLGAVAVPFLLIFAFGLAGPLRAWASETPSCPSCGCYLTS